MSGGRIVTGAALLFVATWACGTNERDELTATSIVEDSAGITLVQNLGPVWTDTVIVRTDPSVQIGSSAGSEYELFRVSGAVRLSDGRIVVANGGTSELRWYSPQGVHLMSSGRSGAGPGEFQFIARLIRLPGDSVLVVDGRLRRYSIVSPDGEFVRTVRVEGRMDAPLPIARLNDGTILMAPGTALALGAQGPPRVERIPLEVVAFTEGSSEPDVLAIFLGLELSIGPSGGTAQDGSMPIGRGPRPFGRNTFVAGDANGWVAGDNDEPRFEVRSPAGEVIAIARWPQQARPVTPLDLAADRAPNLERLADPVARSRMVEAWAQHPEPPETMPPYSSLLLDELGNVWVQDYSPSFEPASNRFRIFDRAGTWLGIAIGPAGVRVLAIGNGWMLGLHRDEFEVETIVLHEFQPTWS
jgi:hypothetical protein